MNSNKEYDHIITGCKSGKLKFQKKLYDMFAGKLLAVCLRYDKNEGEDILQESFIKIFKNIKRYEGKGSFEGWLRRITVNTAITHYHKKNILHKAYNLDDFTEFSNASADDNILDLLNAKELMEVINDLPDIYRVTFNLYAIEGYKHHEIADLLKISQGTSKSQVSRARKMIQEKISLLDITKKQRFIE